MSGATRTAAVAMRLLSGLAEVAASYDAVVLDQWGVLHDGSAPYPHAAEAMRRIAGAARLGVLSNSGKRADPNRERLRALGLPDAAEIVMTSGEALWRDVHSGRVPTQAPLILSARPADAEAWADGLALTPAAEVKEADAVILMGVPPDDPASALDAARRRNLTVFCSNPDRASPRAGGRVVPSPGALAAAHRAKGGAVRWYGKPHRPVFDALSRALGLGRGARILMVGDSPEHDVAGAVAAGWDAALVLGGLHAGRLVGAGEAAVRALCAEEGAPEPRFVLPELRWGTP